MPENGENTEIHSIDEENLKFVFSASHNLKNELIVILRDTKEQIWKVLNFLLLLAGLYSTLIIFICNPQQNRDIPILWPTVLSGIFLLVALIFSIIEIFPSPLEPVIYPKEMYKLVSKRYTESLNLLIPTYLDSVNAIWIKVEEKSFNRQKIIIFVIISVVNFLLFGIYCVFANYKVYLDILSIVFTIALLVFYFWFTKKGRTKIDSLKDKLKG